MKYSKRARRAAALALSAVLLAGSAQATDYIASNKTIPAADNGQGGAVWSSNDISVGDIGVLSFDRNGAYSTTGNVNGGAVYSGGGVTLTGGENSIIELTANSADARDPNSGFAYGGAVWAAANVVISADGKVDVSRNLARSTANGAYGGAVYAASGNIALRGAALTLSDNAASGVWRAYGGALYASGGGVTLSAARSIDLTGNRAEDYKSGQAEGGAIFACTSVDITGGAVTFSGNVAAASGDNGQAKGGAIFAYVGVNITGGSIVFDGNLASAGGEAQGGAVYSGSGITLSGGSIIVQSNDAASSNDKAYGGAIYASEGDITLSGGAILVAGNKGVGSGANGQAYGGAMFSDRGRVTLSADGAVTARNNSLNSGTRGAYGGAVYASLDIKLTGESITLESNNVSGGAEEVDGGALYSLHGDITLTGGSIDVSGNTALSANRTRGGAMYAWKGGIELSADDLIELSGNRAKGDGPTDHGLAAGGALYSHNRNIKLTGGAIAVRGNEAISSADRTLGGALATWYGGIELTADTFIELTGNRAASNTSSDEKMGGGALNALNGNIRLTGGAITVQSNDAVNKSGHVYGGALYAGSSIDMTGSSITVLNNHATDLSTDATGAYGGALYASGKITEGTSGDIRLTGGEIVVRSNDVSGPLAYGGALYANGDMTLTGSSITVQSNDAKGMVSVAYGGALASSGDMTLSAGEVLVSGNSARGADAYGGALCTTLGSFNLTGGTIAVLNNEAAGTNYVLGGAIYAHIAATLSADTSIELTGNRAEASDEDADAKGGAIYSEYAIRLYAASIDARGNEAVSSADPAAGGAFGGALYANNDPVTLSADAVTFSDNRVVSAKGRAQGGAIYAEEQSVTISADSIMFDGNRAVSTKGTAQGGAIWAKGDINLTGGETIELTSNRTDGNYSGNDNMGGGALYASGNIRLKGSSITVQSNDALNRGLSAYSGALYADGNITLTGDSITVRSNDVRATDSEASGGALYSHSGNINLTGGTITVQNNKAMNEGDTTAGGALCANNGAVTLSAEASIELTGNRATGRGARGGAIIANSLFIMSGGTITVQSNDATTRGSSTYGGALYAGNGAVTLSADSITFSGNRAVIVSGDGWIEAQGGAIWTWDSGDIRLTGGTITVQSNDASAKKKALGGAFYAGLGTVTLSADSVTFSGNRAVVTDAGGTAQGGAIWANGDVLIRARRATFATSTDTVWSNGGISVDGTLRAAPGTSFTAEECVTVQNGSLEIWGVTHTKAVVSTDLTAFIAPKADLSVQLALQNGFEHEAGTYSRDFAYVETSELVVPLADNYRNGFVGSSDLGSGEKLTLSYTIEELTWENGDGTWAVHDGGRKWKRDSDGASDDFYQNDLVTFAPTEGDAKKITLSGDIMPSRVRVNGSYEFSGGSLSTVSLDVTGGSALFGSPVSAVATSIGGEAKLTLNAAGVLTTEKYAQHGGSLIVNGETARTAAPLVGSGDAELDVTGGTLYISGAQASRAGTVHHIALGFTKLTPWTHLTGDLSGAHIKYAPQTDNDTGAFDVIVSIENIALTWNGGSTAWTQNDGKKNWLVDADGTTDDFWNGDSVTFTAKNAGTVTLSGDLQAAAMTVNGGEYTFEGDGKLNVIDLTVSGGDVRFAREISAYRGVLSGTGTKLTLEQTLRLTGAFVQNGGTLIVDLGRLNGAAALSGEGKAELKIESGALELIGDTATPEGNTYTIASGFGTIAKVWADGDVSGQAEGKNVQYSVLSDDTSVRVSVTCDEEPKPEPKPQPEPQPVPVGPDPGPGPEPEKRRGTFTLAVGGAFRSALRAGTMLQGRGLELLSAPVNAMNYAHGFLPLEHGKIGGVWASTWYSHARVDNATADMKFKNYGVTIGADRQFGLGVAGIAIDLGKSEGRGKGEFDGTDSDGKHIGVSLYGARPIAGGRVTLTGDIGYIWNSDDYDSIVDSAYYRARKAKSRVFTIGGTAWWNLRDNGRVSVKPFVGVRYSRFSMDDFVAEKAGSAWATIGGESVTQWTVPIGVKFDWTPVTTKRGWKIKPSVELAYVYACGDRAINVRETQLSGGSATKSSQLLSDRNNFRAAIGLDAKRKDFTLGLGVNALMSSGQKDVAVNATLRWDL